jgi:hypothetical protein
MILGFLKSMRFLDERVRPYLMGDGGYLEIIDLKDHTLNHSLSGRVWQLSQFVDGHADGNRKHAEDRSRSGTGGGSGVRSRTLPACAARASGALEHIRDSSLASDGPRTAGKM